MDLLYAVLVSISLNFDDLVLCILSGLILQHFRIKRSLLIALAFAFPQTLFFFLGWLGGIGLKELISAFAPWVALIILTIVGGRMIYEGIKENQEEEEKEKSKIDPLNVGVMILLGFATSFDALAVGVSFGLLNDDILWFIIILFLITFAISLLGVGIGIKFPKAPLNRVAILGGIILIAIGIIIFVEGLFP